MPVIGGAFSCGLMGRRFVDWNYSGGLAQRNRGRKTSNLNALPASLAVESPALATVPALTEQRLVRGSVPLFARTHRSAALREPGETDLDDQRNHFGDPRSHPETGEA
jgi:hypothetical protein